MNYTENKKIVRFKIPKKDAIDLTKLENEVKKTVIDKGRDKYFKAQVMQKDCSDDTFFPKNGMFTLPFEWTNPIYNYAANFGVKGEYGLQCLLEDIFDGDEEQSLETIYTFRNVAQRPSWWDNQCRRYFQVITRLCGGSKRKARKFINENSYKLNELIQQAIREGKEHRKIRKAA